MGGEVGCIDEVKCFIFYPVKEIDRASLHMRVILKTRSNQAFIKPEQLLVKKGPLKKNCSLAEAGLTICWMCGSHDKFDKTKSMF